MKKRLFSLVTAIMVIGLMTTVVFAEDTIDNEGEPSSEMHDYINSIKGELLQGNDVTLERNIVLDGSYITSIKAATNGDGQYLNPGIFNVVGGYGDGEVNFDLNGYTITYIGHADFEYTASEHKPEGGYANSCSYAHGLFLANNGAKITITDSVGTGEINVYGMASGAYSCSPDSVITVKGGTWNNYPCETCEGTNLFMYASHGGELYIEGGRFVQEISSENESYLLVEHGGEYKNQVIDFSKTKVEVSGGTFIGMNPAEAKFCYEDEKGSETWDYTNIVAEGCKAVEIGEGEWTVGKPFTIIFRNRDKEGHIAGDFRMEAVCGQPLTIKANTFKRIGYTFSGWNSKVDGTGTFTYSDGATLTGDEVTKLFDEYAYKYTNNKTGLNECYFNTVWTPNNDTPYKVKHLLLAANGVDVYKAHATYTKRGTTDTLTNAMAVNVEGYSPVDFEQLNINGNGSTVVEIYYERNNYILTYDLNGGEFTDGTENPQTVQYYKKLTAPTEPYRTGYTFAGWNNIPERMPAGDLTITALWTANEYTVSFDTDGGSSEVDDITVTYGSEYGELPIPTKNGYSFMGWFNSDGEEVNATTIVDVAEDHSLTAKWEACDFTIVFRYWLNNTTQGTYNQAAYYDEGLTLRENSFNRAGYTFSHWNSKRDTDDGKFTFADGETLTAEQVNELYGYAMNNNGKAYLNAYWTPNNDTQYKVKHLLLNANGDKVYKAHATYTKYGTTDTLTSAVAVNVEGYSPVAFDQLNINGNGSTVVEIYYERNNYTLSYNLDGGDFTDDTVNPQTVQYYKLLNYPADPIKTGYTFNGWDMLYERMPAGDLTVTALWNANEYTVRFDANGGEGVMDDLSMVYDQEQTLPANAFTNKGYTFSGWKLDEAEYADGADVSNLTAEDNGVVTLSAIWTPNTYTVCFNGNGGSGNMDDISRTFKDKQPLPECGFVREGYTFIGWNTKADAEIAQYVPGDKYNLVSTNGKVVTLYAIWRANGYIVTFDVNGGDELTPGSMPVVYNSVYGTLPTPTRSGYIFKAWTINNTVINADTIVSIVGDHTLVADWTDNEFIVIFETNGGSSVDMQSIPGGGAVTEPTNPTKKDYVFAGWYTDEECSVVFDFSTPIYSDTILYAKWEEAPDSDLNIWYLLLLKLHNQVFEITADAADGGTITPDGITEVKYDNNITYTITPYEGYIIADVIVDGESIGVVSEYTFKDVREAHSISVTFEKAEWKNPFTDVSDEAWYYEDIKYAYENGLMIGTGNDMFSPDELVNRAMLVTVLWRLEGSPIVGGSIVFDDVAADAWYADAVNWASANGIVNGYGDGIFGAINELTHEQIAAILNRYAVYKKRSENLEGAANSQYTYSEWAENNVLWADLNGMFDGIGSDISNLTEGADRAELAAYFRRFCEKFITE